MNPSAAPAGVPATLGTRDPSAPGPGRHRERVSFAVITKPPLKAASSAAAAGAAGAAAKGDPREPHAHIKVKGISGTLNKGDVHQTMEARQELFDACIRDSRRTVRFVSGAVKYAFKVDADGRIAELRPLSSTIGHRELEQCLTAAVASTEFPKPAGRATAEFTWGMSIEPLSERAFENAKATSIKRVARKQAKELFGNCEIKRRKARFRITAYIAAGGRVLSSGAISQPSTADDKVDCVLEEFGKWHLPKFKKASKITFDLR